MRVIISAGGTGGHLYPALVLAETFAGRDKDTKILFITGSGVMEKNLVSGAGYDSCAIEAPGIRRKLSTEAFRSAIKITRAVSRATEILNEFKPDVVVGFGGAVTYPVVRAASKAGVPIVIQEQNVVPGLANKYLSRLASAVAVSSAEAANGWPRGSRVRVTGNPVRISRLDMASEDARGELKLSDDAKVVTVFGGSQGAKHLNETVAAAYHEINNIEDLQLLHITGTRDFDEISAAWTEAGASAKINLLPYLDGMGTAFRASDFVVCRAGASTLAELGIYGVPAIIVPYPYAANNHQAKNAALLESAGAAVTIKDEDLGPGILVHTIVSLLRDPQRLESMAKSMRTTGRPEAANDLANLVIEAAGKVK